MSDTCFGVWTAVLAKGRLQPSGQEKNYDSAFWEFNFARSSNVLDQKVKKTRKDPCFRDSISKVPEVVSKGFLVIQGLSNLWQGVPVDVQLHCRLQKQSTGRRVSSLSQRRRRKHNISGLWEFWNIDVCETAGIFERKEHKRVFAEQKNRFYLFLNFIRQLLSHL